MLAHCAHVKCPGKRGLRTGHPYLQKVALLGGAAGLDDRDPTMMPPSEPRGDSSIRFQWRPRSEIVPQLPIVVCVADIGAGDLLGESGHVDRHLRDAGEIGIGMDRRGRRHMEASREMAPFDDGVVPDRGAVADRAVEHDRVEADENVVANRARSVNDRAVGDRRAGADCDCLA